MKARGVAHRARIPRTGWRTPRGAARLPPPMLEDVKRGRIALPENGVEIATLDFGGSGPLALLHHANGFCAAVWAPVATALTRHYRVIAMDARGHGRFDQARGRRAPTTGTGSAATRSASPTRCCREHGASQHRARARPLVRGHGAAHGLGAAARALRAPRAGRPDRAAAARARARRCCAARTGTRFADGARQRRAVWPSRDAAREKWSGKELFANWDPRVFELYLAEGLHDRPDGQVELACPPGDRGGDLRRQPGAST